MNWNGMKYNDMNWSERDTYKIKINKMEWNVMNEWKKLSVIIWNDMEWYWIKYNELQWNIPKWNKTEWNEMKWIAIEWTGLNGIK